MSTKSWLLSKFLDENHTIRRNYRGFYAPDEYFSSVTGKTLETFLEEAHSKLVSIGLMHLLTFDFHGFFVECF